jgi:putative peptidoglycan lipid II flippase
MAANVDVTLIGNYRTATNFAILLTFFTVPITTVLFPTFSKLDHENEQQTLKTVFTSSVKYASLFLIPATMAMMVLSKPLIATLYGNKWLEAPIFLSLSVIINLLVIFGNLSLGSLLQGLGETKLLMKLSSLTLSIGVPMGTILIPPLGIIGFIIVTVTAGIPGFFIGLHWVWKHYGTKPDFSSSAKIFLASLLAATTTYATLTILTVPNWMLLTTGIILFLTIYIATAPLVGAINQADINNLRAMLSSLGIISKLIDIPLTIIQKILSVRSNKTFQI